MSDAGRRESRVFTAVCLVLAGLSAASVFSPSLEAVLNVWLGGPVVVLAVGWVAVLVGRAVWSWALIEWELRRPLGEDEVHRPEREGL